MIKKFGTGFTLIELMLTVAIIGILAAIALPAYNDYIIRSKVVEGFTMSVEARSTVNEFYLYTGRMPLDNEEAGLAAANSYRGNHIISMLVENGAIHIEYDNLSYENQNPVLTLRPYSGPDGNKDLIWACSKNEQFEGLTVHGVSKTTIENKYLPANCRY